MLACVMLVAACMYEGLSVLLIINICKHQTLKSDAAHVLVQHATESCGWCSAYSKL